MRSVRPIRVLAALPAIGLLLAGAAPAHAEVTRAGQFLCQSNIIRLADKVWTQANPTQTPCVDDFEALDRQDVSFLGLYRVQTSVIDVRTDQTPNTLSDAPPAAGDLASASARLASVRITGPGLTVEFAAAHADAVATCAAAGGGLAPAYTARSTVSTLRINGENHANVTEPRDIKLSTGTLRLNRTTTTATGITRQAAVWDTSLFDLILGEAKVNAPGGNPCAV